MTAWEQIVRGAAWGAGLGAVFLSLLALLWWMVFAPDGLKDGQFVLIFYLFTIPCGAPLGGVAGVAKVVLDLGARTTAGWVCLGGGGLVTGLIVLYGLWLLGTDKFVFLVHPAYGAILVWAAIEMIAGVMLLWRR
jgi:hypothetical protein